MNPVHPTVAKRCGGIAARSLAVAGCAALLAACTTANQVTGSMPSDYRQRHPIVLQEAPRAVDLLIGDRRGTLTGPQRAEVLAFAREWVRESTGGILIDVPSGTSNANAAANATHEVRSILAASGVPPQAIELRTYRPNDPAKLATLRLHYPKVRADAGPCGLWPKDLGPTNDREHLENRTYWNFGCATQRNLAAMVDNPADLVQPRSDIPAYTGRRTTVLDKYHRGESSATTYADSNRGKISDVGQ
ncbi:MAG: pilus assembly protein CpaD [Alphaproteobacteria bacterium]|jgi:pilus assembly protein CpaD|nr:pilus assembly protein CpaD [Alphaproteobacteria bacterium]MEA2988193.1 pilus assembly protein CpaD [Alphaproteobacteria bacterium]